MHLNPEGNAATTRNEHNTVLGKPHLHQNQQRRTPGGPHQCSQLASIKPTTTTDRCRSAQPEVQHDTQGICLARAKMSTEQKHNAQRRTGTQGQTDSQHNTHPNNKGDI
ncbi:hypothetical protein Taro_019181 [Colocasia esculenta]|uniref:Uncharacterized protein n=1 Tax=Colocasia esculenta TaxID=4460 RepID=A0A843UT33_COLES|nr:hypothetical protein [Colocasia esculenta]